MTHSELELQVNAYLDGELATQDAHELEAHLKECRDCSRLRDSRLALSAAIRAELPAFRAPDELRNRVRTALKSSAQVPASRRPMQRGWWPLALAASLAVVALGTWQLASTRAEGAELGEQVLASHVRSLMPGHLTDVVSSDQHTVKPWFNGKLDFSPPVYDFAGKGYPLIGGRLDYVGDRPVAALVYGRRQHFINVFLWPVSRGMAGRPPHATTRQGYHLLHWNTPEFAYWVASDLGLAELDEFARMLRET